MTVRLGLLFPGLIHVRDVGLKQARDEEIWDWAKEESYTLITADADFLGLLNRRGTPPKLIHLDRCDFPFQAIEELLRRNAIRISEFEKDPHARLLTILPSPLMK